VIGSSTTFPKADGENDKKVNAYRTENDPEIVIL
jgi:hypothetical protein